MNKPDRSPRQAARIYALILRCYPAGYRQAFGDHMLRTFLDCYADVQEESRQVSLFFWINMIGDEVVSIAREWNAFFIEWELGMINSPSSRKQWGIGIGIGLVLVAVSGFFGLIGGQGFSLAPVVASLALLLVLIALGIVLLGKGVVFKNRHFPGLLAALTDLNQAIAIRQSLSL